MASYLRRISETAGRAVKLDPDTYTSPESHDIALLAAGAAVQAVDHALSGPQRSALALVRPPGHHAERDRAMGFCLYNNVAVAAAHARANGAAKVAIVDYDVHHGNGTQHIFEDDPHVLYISTHQFPYYPGTGAAGEVGRGAGAGFTVNVPLEVGAVDEDYQTAFSAVILPVLSQFKPDLVIVSAGFDAHERDPLGGDAPLDRCIRRDDRRVARGRGASWPGPDRGGDRRRLRPPRARRVAGRRHRNLNGSPQPARWPRSGVASDRGRAAVEAVTRALSPFWRF